MPDTIITYPYPPLVQMPDGEYYDMPDIVTLVKMVYDLKHQVAELKGEPAPEAPQKEREG
jgi:hypothetical protein